MSSTSTSKKAREWTLVAVHDCGSIDPTDFEISNLVTATSQYGPGLDCAAIGLWMVCARM